MQCEIVEEGPWKLYKRGPSGYTELENGIGANTSADYPLNDDENFIVIPDTIVE